MIIIGVTGSIGMGKSTIASMLGQALNSPVYNADAAVHKLLDATEIKQVISVRYPQVMDDSGVNRSLLGKLAFSDQTVRHWLEQYLHPQVREIQMQVITRARLKGHKAVILDIPLLFETGAERTCDWVIVASAPLWIQRRRVMARAGMTKQKFLAINARQWSDAKKRYHASCVVWTGGSMAATKRQVQGIANAVPYEASECSCRF